MKSRNRTEEEQKNYIFDIFSKCRNETAPSRLQVHSSMLCEQIYLWYKDFLSVDVDKMGLEITKVVNRFTKNENISKIPGYKDDFFKYLAASIKREVSGFHHEFDENNHINIPKEKKRKLRELGDFIRMKESQLGRKLTADEEKQGISKWFKGQEYIDLLNVKYIGSLDAGNDETGGPNNVDPHSDDPLEKYISKTDMETVLEAVISVLAKKQKRARDCYKALLTLYCIKNNLSGLYPVLDQEIIDAFHKDGKKPKQYEIYLKYHPETDKKGAEAMNIANAVVPLTLTGLVIGLIVWGCYSCVSCVL